MWSSWQKLKFNSQRVDLNCPITFKLELGSGNKEPMDENEKLKIISKFAPKKNSSTKYSKNVTSNWALNLKNNGFSAFMLTFWHLKKKK